MAENRRNVLVVGCSKVGETPMYHIKKQPSDRSYGKMIAGWKSCWSQENVGYGRQEL